jgi:hypothetical protein
MVGKRPDARRVRGRAGAGVAGWAGGAVAGMEQEARLKTAKQNTNKLF